MRIAGLFPLTWLAWHDRSVYVSMAAYIAINTIFLGFLMSALLGG